MGSLRARSLGRVDLVALAFFSMLPDIDHLLEGGSRVYLHNLTALSIVLVASLLVSARLCYFAAAGAGSHIAIDLADRGGIALLYPFTSHRYRLGLWHSPEPKFTNSKGLPLDLALACIFLAAFLIMVFRKGEQC